MIKQNIKVALFVVLGMLILWLVLLCFIKIDISSSGVITYEESMSFLTISTKTGSYIEKHEIDYIKMEYEKQYFNCHITYSSADKEFTYYLISLPDIVDKSTNYLNTNIIVDSVNVYQYLIKK